MAASATVVRPSTGAVLTPPASLDGVKDLKSVGVTGTREGMPGEQQHAFFSVVIDAIRLGATEIHHGACLGADAFIHFHMINQLVITHVHPPTDTTHSAMDYLMRHNRRVDHEPKPYAERNQDIVDASDVVIAAPKYPEKDPRAKRSGTWMTVRKAHDAGKLVVIADSEGKVAAYDPENG